MLAVLAYGDPRVVAGVAASARGPPRTRKTADRPSSVMRPWVTSGKLPVDGEPELARGIEGSMVIHDFVAGRSSTGDRDSVGATSWRIVMDPAQRDEPAGGVFVNRGPRAGGAESPVGSPHPVRPGRGQGSGTVGTAQVATIRSSRAAGDVAGDGAKPPSTAGHSIPGTGGCPCRRQRSGTYGWRQVRCATSHQACLRGIGNPGPQLLFRARIGPGVHHRNP